MSKTKGPNVGYIRKEVAKELPKWQLVDDAVEGEDAIKAKGETYLPKPETHVDVSINNKIYAKYKLRAVFFPVTTRTLSGLCGQVFSKPVATEIPPTLESMVQDVDGAGTSLEQQSKETLGSVLKKGRAGLLSDFPRVAPGQVVTKADVDGGKIRPRILFYKPGQIINWREQTIGGETKLALLVLFEHKIIEDDGFEMTTAPRWRVYRLTDSGVSVSVWKLDENKARISECPEYVIDEEEALVIGANQQPLQTIPFSPVGSQNNNMDVDESPIYPLSVLNIAHYRNSADYEQSLFFTGQIQPVFSGLTDDWVKNHIEGKVTLGSATPVSLPVGGKAELLQAAPNSMPMEGMTHKEDQMKAIGAKLIEPGTVQRTATEAEIEETSEASILSSVAKNVSAAYEMALYYCSLFIGEVAQDQISVALNSEFQVTGLNAVERTEVMTAWQSGLLTRDETREVYRRKGIATETNEDAWTKIENEGVPFDDGNADE
jgi:hypothetical protein